MSGQLRRVELLGGHVRVAVRQGSGDGPPLVLCNGIGASLDLLQPFVDALDSTIEVVRFDVPGVGGSTPPPLPYTFPLLACWLGKLLDRLEYDKVDVLGISWGGGLAQQFAFQNPRRCRKLVLVSTATGALMVPARPAVLRHMLTPRRYRDAKFAVDAAPDLYGGQLRRDPESVTQLLLKEERLGTRSGYLLQLAAGLGWTSLPFLPTIRQRTLILAGEDDPLIPPVNARIMRRLLPHANLHTYDDGHLGIVTHAAGLAPVIRDFLRNHDR
ncbi:poly(3-hydroxyalkanoate) depolymerase [Mycobacterium sp.]|uniref:poly(3-hydroxyalkanoate) depolymerase n=1 Tax=Mycobacterium sp. TaxID=1785 RepID=UPI002CC4CCB1|nr:poly(3-hydroxyalkanoate) depolymerase [Mycobacterium sp.]HTQ17301.1 poly(3-hydroxyalkanoate) depolymerase [Mycobacterium sp.]